MFVLSPTHSGGILNFMFWILGLNIAYFVNVLLLLRFWVPRFYCRYIVLSFSHSDEVLFVIFGRRYHFYFL